MTVPGPRRRVGDDQARRLKELFDAELGKGPDVDDDPVDDTTTEG